MAGERSQDDFFQLLQDIAPQTLGADASEARQALLRQTAVAHRIIMRVEAAAVHEDLFQQHREKYRPHIRSFIESGMLIPSVQYVRAQRLRRRLQRELEPHLAQVDAVLTPTTPTPAPHGLQATGDPVFQTPWTFLGIPALTLPCGIAENGLPLGLQLASAPFTEARLLAVARWCERTLAFTARPTLVEGALGDFAK